MVLEATFFGAFFRKLETERSCNLLFFGPIVGLCTLSTRCTSQQTDGRKIRESKIKKHKIIEELDFNFKT